MCIAHALHRFPGTTPGAARRPHLVDWLHALLPCPVARRVVATLTLATIVAACAPAFVASRQADALHDGERTPPATAALAEATPRPTHVGRQPTAPGIASSHAAAATWIGRFGGRWQRDGALALRLATDRGDDPLGGELTFEATPASDAFTRTDARTDARGAARGAARTHTTVRVVLTTARREGARMTLVSAPYYDPRCACTATLTLDGVAHGDTLAGRYEARTAATRAADRGRWRVVRRPGSTDHRSAAAPRAAIGAAPASTLP